MLFIPPNVVAGGVSGVSGVLSFASRASAIAATITAATTQVVTYGYAAASDGGAGCYARVSVQPTHAGKFQSADGTWWELYPPNNNYVYVKQFGAVADGVTDDWQAFEDCRGYIVAKSTLGTVSNLNYNAGFTMCLPLGTCYLSQTHQITGTGYNILGIGSGMAGGGLTGRASVMLFAPNVTGIICERVNTSGTNPAAVALHGGGAAPTINGVSVIAAAGSTFGGAFDGIWLRGRANLHNCTFSNFARDGIHIEATSLGSPEGEANNWRIDTCRVDSNLRDGIYISGGDSNNGTCILLDCSFNGRWGVYDNSFLGNTFIGIHTTGNALYGGRNSVVNYNNNAWSVMPDQAVAAATTTPGTNSTIWALKSTSPQGGSPAPPTWTNGMANLTDGGGYRCNNTTSVFLHPYQESDQSSSYFQSPTIVVGGNCTYTSNTNAMVLKGPNFRDVVGTSSSLGTTFQVSIGGDEANGQLLAFASPTFPLNGALRVFGNDLRWDYGNQSSTSPYTITGPSTALAFGRSAAVPHALAIGAGVWIGDNISLSGSRNLQMGTAAPTTGAYAQGDVVFNSGAAVGQPKGWRCTVAGTPGTWVSEGNL